MGLPGYLFLFFIGAALGSFLNVIVDRLPRRESFLTGRSHCEHCRHKLFWYDLIPLFSYIALNGQCRYCKKQLSLYYPVVEATTGLAFVSLFAFIYGADFISRMGDVSLFSVAVYLWVVLSALIVIFFVDLKYGIIPFSVVSFTFLLSVVWYFISPTLVISPVEIGIIGSGKSFLNHLFSAIGAFASFLFLFLITRGRGLGFGDVVYVFLMGFLLGFPKIVIGLYIAFLSGAVISFLLVILGRKKFSGGTIPFGPFLVSGTVISLFWGDKILAMAMAFLLSR